MGNTLANSTNRRYFAFLLKNNRRYMFLYGFALLIAFPIFCLSLSTTTTQIEGLYYVGKVLSLLIVIMGTILIPLLFFQFTTSKRSVDVFHSLPIQKEYLFMTNYFAGIVMLLAPYLLSTILGVGVCIALGMNQISLYLEVTNFLLTSLALLVSYSITMFAKKNCGTIVDAFLYTIALNLIPILAYVSYYMFCSQILLGFNEPFGNNIFYYLTPFPAMFIYAVRNTSNMGFLIPGSALWFYGLVIVVLYFVSSHLFVNHKSERTNMPFVNRYFYPIVSFISTVIAIVLIHSIMNSMFNYDGISTYVFPLLVGAIFYLILDVIANRGFKNLPKTLLRIALICGVVLAMIVPTRLTNGFGYITRVPDLDDIESVSINIGYELGTYVGFHDYRSERVVTFTDPDEIAIIRDMHLSILDFYSRIDYDKSNFYNSLNSAISPYPGLSGNYVSSSTIELKYDLGLTKLNRYYQVATSWTHPLISLAASDAMIDARYPMVVRSEQYTKKSIWLTDVFDTNETMIHHAAMSLSWDVDGLMDAIELDLKNETTKQFFDSEAPTLGYLRMITSSNQPYPVELDTRIPIKANFTNTLQFFAANNMEFPTTNLDQFTNSNFILVYPDRDENRETFYWNMMSSGDYGMKGDLYDFQYKDVTFSELKELIPYVHHAHMTNEINLILIAQNSDGQWKSYFIRNKDVDLVNTIVTDEMHNEPGGIYDLFYRKSNGY